MSRAVDTNVVVRFLTGDDARQSMVATDVLRAGFTLTHTVTMETAWVLRSVYGWPRERIAAALAELIDLPSADVVPDGIRWALDRFAAGAALADMVHVTMATGASAFATFDTRVAEHAGPNAPVRIETLA